MDLQLALGIDIGGTNTVFGLCSKEGEIVYEQSIPTTNFNKPIDLIHETYSILDGKGYLENIIGIGIGAPNGNFYSGSIEFAPNLTWKGIIPLAEMFELKFDKPTLLTNDANAAAIGEMIYGNATDLSHFVMITLGTGLGSGVVIDKKLVYGDDGFAGEYGHIRVVPGGRLCGCGRKGCLETYASSTGVVRSVSELESKHKSESILSANSDVTARDVFVAAEQGDLFATEIVDYTATILGNALADFTCFSSPQSFVLFGGIAQNGNSFAKKVETIMDANLLKIYKTKVDVRISSLHAKNAAVLGASSLVWNDLV